MRTLVLVVGAAPTTHKVQRLLTMRAQQHPLLGSVHQLRPYISGNPGLRRSGSPPPLRQHRRRGAHRPARDGALRVLGERALRVVQDQVLVSVGGSRRRRPRALRARPGVRYTRGPLWPHTCAQSECAAQVRQPDAGLRPRRCLHGIFKGVEQSLAQGR